MVLSNFTDSGLRGLRITLSSLCLGQQSFQKDDNATGQTWEPHRTWHSANLRGSLCYSIRVCSGHTLVPVKNTNAWYKSKPEDEAAANIFMKGGL